MSLFGQKRDDESDTQYNYSEEDDNEMYEFNVFDDSMDISIKLLLFGSRFDCRLSVYLFYESLFSTY